MRIGLELAPYTTSRLLDSPFYQAAMQAYLLSTIEEKIGHKRLKTPSF